MAYKARRGVRAGVSLPQRVQASQPPGLLVGAKRNSGWMAPGLSRLLRVRLMNGPRVVR
jgi:hypothetical protein